MPKTYSVLLSLGAFFAFPAFAQDDPGSPVPPPDYKPSEVLDPWPGTPPGETDEIGEEVMLVERRHWAKSTSRSISSGPRAEPRGGCHTAARCAALE